MYQPEKMQRKKHSAEFKAKVALEALKGDRTINDIAGAHQVHPNQVSNWKKDAQAWLVECFSIKRCRKNQQHEADQVSLYTDYPFYGSEGSIIWSLIWLT